MRSLRFVDCCAPRPYADPERMQGLGGTEATLLRIAVPLGRRMHVTVEQLARREPEIRDGVHFLPLNLHGSGGDIIIVINSWKVALVCRKRTPNARIFVWQHVVPGRHNRTLAADLAGAGIEILCVSDTLARMVHTFLDGLVRVSAVPNPIADFLVPDDTRRDPNLLLFASSPHKGLDQVAAAFATLRRIIPSLRLELADPGYLAWDNGQMPDGVVPLGILTHPQVITRMRRALCLFYPQRRFAETFGLVLAEANAVGCPVLVQQGLGANDEVTSSAVQRINTADPQQIVDTIVAWRKQSPCVSVLPQFRLQAVLARWDEVLATVAMKVGPPVSAGAFTLTPQVRPQGIVT